MAEELKKEVQPISCDGDSIEDLKKALAEEKIKSETNLNGWQRAQADFTNYKRFVEQDKAESLKFANAALMVNILPVLDDLERALAAVSHKDAHHKSFEGFKMIEKKFRGILEKMGITPVLALGMEYDCRTMEAITCVKGKQDIVIQELEKGYKIQDKVIRPAKVVVGNGEETSDKEE